MRAQTGELEETTEAVMEDIQLLGESVSKVCFCFVFSTRDGAD